MSADHFLFASSFGPAVIDRRYRRARLQFDCALEDKLGRSGECDIREALAVAAKIYTQFAAATHQHANGPVGFFRGRKNERACHDASTTGQRFALDSTLISADC